MGRYYLLQFILLTRILKRVTPLKLAAREVGGGGVDE